MIQNNIFARMRVSINYKNEHWKSLDGVRGIAILTVFLYHIFHFENSIIKNILKSGWIGVDLFFVLSGFLITGILYDSKGSINYYKFFFAKRILRIFPLYYLVLLLFFGAAFLFGNSHFLALHYSIDAAPWFFTYTQNMFFSFKGWPANLTLNHFWSLAIEEQFYLIWPFVIALANYRKILLIAIAGVIISIVIRNIHPELPFAYAFTFARFDALLTGGIAAIMIRKKKQLLESIVVPLFIILAVALSMLLFLTGNSDYDNIYFIRFGYTVIEIIFGCIIVSLFDTGKLGRMARAVFEIRPLLFLGKYSYGIYVYHWILYCLFFSGIVKTVNKLSFLSTGIGYLLSLAIFVCLVLTVSYASYNFIEKKFLKLKKHLV